MMPSLTAFCKQSRLIGRTGVIVLACLLLPLAAEQQAAGRDAPQDKASEVTGYPKDKDSLTTADCMRCHPMIAEMLRTRGAMHSRVECRQCHLDFHTYVPGKTNYTDILPKCARCHEHPHGEDLVDCSGCHQEAHSPLVIPASRALSQGCYVCHVDPDKDIKTFTTRHTDLYCTACHHSKHGHIPDCLECHKKHEGTVPTPGRMTPNQAPLDQCTDCHPPHKVFKVAYSNQIPRTVCTFCHRKAGEMLSRRKTKHSLLACTFCHPDQHQAIKRCVDCHGKPHPDKMLKKFSTCGGCHGVAHSVVR